MEPGDALGVAVGLGEAGVDDQAHGGLSGILCAGP
jgi:hypothetical protein